MQTESKPCTPAEMVASTHSTQKYKAQHLLRFIFDQQLVQPIFELCETKWILLERARWERIQQQHFISWITYWTNYWSKLNLGKCGISHFKWRDYLLKNHCFITLVHILKFTGVGTSWSQCSIMTQQIMDKLRILGIRTPSILLE
jgi:hypothetical protein